MAPVRPRRVLLIPLLLVLVPLTGCLGGGEEPLDGETPAATTGPADVAGETVTTTVDGDALPEANATLPAVRTLYVSADGSLSTILPGAATMAMGGSYVVCFLTPPCDFLAFTSMPLTESVVLPPQTVKVTLHLEAIVPVAPGAFGVATWFGSPIGMPLDTIVEVGPMAPGMHQVDVSLQVERPIVIPKGQPFQFYTLAGNMHEHSGTLLLHTGGDAASAIEFLAMPIELPAGSAGQPETFTGSLPLPTFPAGSVSPEHSVAEHTFTVGPNATSIVVSLRQSGGPRAGDLDLDLLMGGNPIAASHTPLDTEGIYLAGPAMDGLRGAELTVRVSNFFSPDATYEVLVTQA